jgi:23S rRNA pseudouridine2605 synthase
MTQQRLQKLLAAAGIASRRKSEELILTGAVRVNGKVVNTLPAFVNPQEDLITVNGRKIRAAPKVYFLLNKPKGVICSNSDPQGRKKAIDIVKSPYRIFCIGRLDIDSTGLIILTNDSELTNRLTHPRYQIPKTYLVTVKGAIQGPAVEKLKKGIWLAEGKTQKAAVKILKRRHNESTIEVTIRQGLNRQVRRMLTKIGFDVKSLKRIKIAKLSAQGLGVGRSRPLTKTEITYLRKISKLQTARARKF